MCEEAEDKVGKKVAVGFEGLGMRIFSPFGSDEPVRSLRSDESSVGWEGTSMRRHCRSLRADDGQLSPRRRCAQVPRQHSVGEDGPDAFQGHRPAFRRNSLDMLLGVEE